MWNVAALVAGSGSSGVGVPADPYGPELWPQPTFDASTGLTLNGWGVSGGAATAPGSTAIMEATALDTLTAGTYKIEINISANPDVTQFGIGIGSVSAGTVNTAGGGTGLQILTPTVASVANQLIKIRDNNGDGGGNKITSFSVKKVL
jgi:hypothetical protein